MNPLLRRFRAGAVAPPAAPASALFFVVHPAAGLAGVDSDDFVVGANGTISGVINVTLHDDDGTFTPPTSVVLDDAGHATAAFKYRPTTAGTKTIFLSNDRALGNPTPVSYGATAGDASPVFSFARVSELTPSKLVITYDVALGTSTSTSAGNFTLVAGGRTITGVARVGNTIEINMSAPFVYGTTGTIAVAAGVIFEASNTASAGAHSASAITNLIPSGSDVLSKILNLRVNGAASPAGSKLPVIWDPQIAARDHVKQYRVQGSGTWLTQSGPPADWEEYDYIGLSPTLTYEFQVAGVDELGATGTFSDTLTVTMPASSGDLWDEDFEIGKGMVAAASNIPSRIPDVSNAEGHLWVMLAENGLVQLDQGDAGHAKFFLSVGLWHDNTARKNFTWRVLPWWGIFTMCVRDNGNRQAGSCEATDAYAVNVNSDTGAWQIRRYAASSMSVLQSGTITLGPAFPHAFDLVMTTDDHAQFVCDGANVGSAFAITGASWGCSVRNNPGGECHIDRIRAIA